MKRKKTKKLTFEDTPPIQSPFASLGELIDKPDKTIIGAAPSPASTIGKDRTKNSLLIREEKRSKGKRVTCIYHIEGSTENLLKELKKRLGAGGSLTAQGDLEIQGSHVDKIRSFFSEKGYKTR